MFVLSWNEMQMKMAAVSLKGLLPPKAQAIFIPEDWGAPFTTANLLQM